MKWEILKPFLSAMLVAVVAPLGLGAQQDPGVLEQAARAVMTAQEWLQVDKEGKPSKRVRKLLEIAADRLRQAQALTAQEQLAEATTLVENYTTLISYGISFIDSLPENQRKRQRNAYKEFDVRLRQQIPALMELRRSFPTDSQALENALFTAQRLRIIALNGFSGAEIIKVPEP
jgi:hypothetical protein